MIKIECDNSVEKQKILPIISRYFKNTPYSITLHYIPIIIRYYLL